VKINQTYKGIGIVMYVETRQVMTSIFLKALILFWAIPIGFGYTVEEVSTVLVKVNGREQRTTLLSHLTDLNPTPIKLSKYGGRIDRKEKASGFFYTKRVKTGWIMVDPDGYHYFNLGVNSTSPNDTTPDHKKAFAETFKDRSTWVKKTHELLVDYLKYNSLGCWSDWKSFKEAGVRIPYIRRWNLMASYGKKKQVTYAKYGHTGFQQDVLPVFDKGFAKHCDDVCKKMVETQDDPWLVGHFSDNELPFKSQDMIKRYMSCMPDDESRIAVEKWLKANGVDRKRVTDKHDTKFAAFVLLTYYKTVHDAIRKHDPNHMILGSRLHGLASSQKICYTASGPFVDVVSINYYNRWTPRQKELDKRAELAKKPILITEWYAKGADSGLKNNAGAGFTVPTQKDRGRFYENYAIGLLKNQNVVGWHWFRYIDDGDLKTKGKSSNKGILDLNFIPYKELCDSMRAINVKAYQLSDLFRKPL
jgi:hypothetical protein